MRGLVLITTVCLGCGLGWEPSGSDPLGKADGPGAAGMTHRLRLVSHNAYLTQIGPDGLVNLGRSVFEDDAAKCRARAIGEALAEQAPDIVGLQEAMHVRYAPLLFRELGFVTPEARVRQPEGETFDGHPGNGGLALLADHHVIDVGTETFDGACNAYLTDGNDCFVNKGLLFGSVLLDGDQRINVLVTHLDSGTDDDSARARQAQLEVIRDYLESRKAVARWPTVVLADLNVDALAGDDAYDEALELLSSSELDQPVDLFEAYLDRAKGAADAQERHGPTLNCLDGLDPCDKPWPDDPARQPQRTNYQLLYPAGRNFAVTRFKTLALQDDACDTGYLSDHKALVVDLALNFGAAIADADEADVSDGDDDPESGKKKTERTGGGSDDSDDGPDYWGRTSADEADVDDADTEPMAAGGGCGLAGQPGSPGWLLLTLLALFARRWRRELRKRG